MYDAAAEAEDVAIACKNGYGCVTKGGTTLRSVLMSGLAQVY